MPRRWSILAVLFMIRAIMAIQYQSVAGVAPLLNRHPGLDLIDIGVLIGIYMAPGMLLALPGGAIGRRVGDKKAVLFGLALMTVGGLVMALSEVWSVQIGGRLVAGVGGVLLSVLLSNMVADWFGPEEIGRATAVLMVSWPVGLAVSLMTIPAIAAAYSVGLAHLAVAGITAMGFVVLATYYSPRKSSLKAAAVRAPLQPHDILLVFIAALAWSLFGVGYAMILGFGPSMLTERGWSITEAGKTTSIVIWLGAFSTLIGGAVADRTRQYNLISVGAYLLLALLLVVAPRTNSIILIFIALGVVSGLPVASVTSLPVRLLAPEVRPIGLGLFYTVFYCGMMVGPALGGRYASLSGEAGAAFDFGAAMVLLAAAMLCAGWYLLPVPAQASRVVM